MIKVTIARINKVIWTILALALLGIAAPACALTSQNITFGALPPLVNGATPFVVSATATSGLAVTFSTSSTTVCTVSGNVVSILGVGTCTVAADQAGNATYASAPEVLQAFTVVANSTSSDAYFSGDRLLMHMDGTNGSTVFADVKGHAFTSHGTPQISTVQSKFGGASFSTGNVGYISTPAAPEFAIGTNDFTVEAWVYPLNASTGTKFGTVMYQCILSQQQLGTSTQAAFNIGIGNGNLIGEIVSSQSGQGVIASTTALPLNTWSHVALVGYGGNVTLYLNGQSVGTTTRGTQVSSTLPIVIGADAVGQGIFNGYIDEVRYTNGTARYTANFTPSGPFAGPSMNVSLTNQNAGQTLVAPATLSLGATATDSIGSVTQISFYNGSTLLGTANATPFNISVSNLPAGNYNITAQATDNAGQSASSNTVQVTVLPISGTDPFYADDILLMHMDGINATTVFADVKGHVFTPQGSGAQISTVQSMSGGASFLTNNTGYISTPAAPEFAISTNDFTVEAWVYPLNEAAGYKLGSTYYQSIVGQQQFGTQTQAAFNISIQNGILAAEIVTPQYSAQGVITSGTTLPLNTWSHVAFVGYGNTVTLYLNGQNVGTSARGGAQLASTLPITIGADAIGQGIFDGYIDEVRYTNGAARYTSNFTVPAAAYPGAPISVSVSNQNPGLPLFAPATLTLNAAVSDSVGNVTQVSFYNGSSLLGAVSQAPYSISLPNLPTGTYNITAHVSDDAGLSAASNALTLYVGTPDVSVVDDILLMHMDGANGSKIFTDGRGHGFTGIGSAQISTAQSKFGGASLSTGNAGYIMTPSAPEFAIGTSDFTVEAWVYPLNTSTGTKFGTVTYQSILSQQQLGTSTQAALNIGIGNGNLTGEIVSSQSGQGVITSTTALPLNTWSHVALVGYGGSVTLYLNGQSVGTTTRGTQLSSTLPIVIGADAIGQGIFNGYIDEVRYTNGLARYTANFTPTGPLADSAVSIALAPFSGGQGPLAPALIGLSPTLGDTIGSISQVNYYNGSVLLGTKTAVPFDLSVPNLPAGIYNFIAQASDNKGQSSISNVATLMVNGTDPYLNDDVLLMHMDGVNGGTAFVDVKGHAITTHGTPQTSTAQSAFGGASLAASNVGYLTTPAAPEFAIGTNDFTVEMWAYLQDPTTGTNGYQSILLQQQFGTMNQSAMAIWIQSGALCATIVTPQFAQGAGIVGTSVPLPVGVWSHIAFVGYGNKVTLYLNGKSIATAPRGGAQVSSTLPISVGADAIGQAMFNGYIDEVRYSNGVARYTSNFNPTGPFGPAVTLSIGNAGQTLVEPAALTLNATANDPTSAITQVIFASGSTVLGSSTQAPYTLNLQNLAAGNYNITAQAIDSIGQSATSNAIAVVVSPISGTDPYFNDDILLMHMDGANASTIFTDVKGHAFTSHGTPQISTVQSKFGGASFSTGNAGYISTPAAPEFAIGTNDFTVEAWVYPRNASTGTKFGTVMYQSILSQQQLGTSTQAAFNIGIGNGNLIGEIVSSQSGQGVIASTTALPLNTWSHMALVGYGGNVTLYLNGQSVGTTTRGTQVSSTLPIVIGADAVGQGIFNGYIDEARYTNGVARYTTNFTPSGPFPNFAEYLFPTGTSPTVNVAAGQQSGFVFVGASGQIIDLSIAGVTTTPNGGSVTATLHNPDGTVLGTFPVSGGAGTYRSTALSQSGNYTVTFSAGSNAASMTASLAVVAPPTISLSSSGQGQTLVAPASIPLTAVAASSVGVTQVAFYSGSAVLGTVTGTSSPYAFNWNGVVVGTYNLTAVVTDVQGNQTTSAPINVTVIPAGQTITFTTVASTPFAAAITLNASASSGLPVSFASTTTSVCTVTGNTVSTVAVGPCTIVASQAGNANYPAAQVSQTFNITQAAQSIAFGTPANTTAGTTVILTATATSGLGVSFASSTSSTCSVNGNTVTTIAAGQCSIVASQAGNTNYAAAPAVTQSIAVTAPIWNTSAWTEVFTFGGPAAYGKGIFVSVAWNSTTASYSVDGGVTWKRSTLPANPGWAGVAYGNGLFVATAYGTSTYATSPDGITWTPHTFQTSANWNVATYGNGVFVVVAAGGSVSAASSDGVNWTYGTLPASATWSAITFGNGKFVAVNNGSATTAISTDGINWMAGAMPASAPWSAIAYGQGNFVALAANSAVGAISPDGLTWTQTSMPRSDNWGGIAYGNGLFVAVDGSAQASGSAATSEDGINWTNSTLPFSNYWTGVAYGNNQFVATTGGDIGAVLTRTEINPPTVSLTSPTTGQSFAGGAVINLTANVASNFTGIAQVQYFNGTALIGSATAAPYTFAWNNAPAGVSSITAVVTDSAGGSATSAAVPVTVGNAAGTPVSISLTSPIAGQTLPAPATLTLTANVTDSNSATIPQVAFYNDTTLLATAAQAPYTVTLPYLEAGTYNLTAQAIDSLGASAVSAPVVVTITLPNSLSVNLVNVNFSANPASTTYGSIQVFPVITDPSDGSLLMDQQGSSYYIAWSQGYVQQIKPDGTAGIQWADLNTARGLALAKDGSGVLVGTAAGLMHLGFDGSITTVNANTDLGHPFYGPNGVLYCFGGATATVYQLNDAFQESVYLPSGTLAGIAAMAFDGSGNMILASYSSNQIARVNPDKSIVTLLSYTGPLGITPYGQGWLMATINGGYLVDSQWQTVTQLISSRRDTFVVLPNGNVNVATWNVTGVQQLVPQPTAWQTSGNNAIAMNAPGPLILAATTMDGTAAVSQVGFYANGVLLGSISPGPYTFIWNNIAPGAYTVTAQASDTAGNSAISPPINLTVAGPIITNPTAGQIFHTPTSMVLAATATSTTGTVTGVSYFDNGVLVGAATQSPYSYSWSNIPGGTHTITATATDSAGNTLPSALVRITVEALPVVTLTSPTAGQMTGDNFALSATVSETGGTITQVTFYNGSNLLGTTTQAPYGVVFKDMTPGTYVLTAQATDAFGQTATSAAVTVTVVAVGGGGAGNEVVYDIHTDQVNTPRLVSDQNGNIVWQWLNLDPFGDSLPNQDPNGTGNQFAFNLRFPGQYYDLETGTHYNAARDYDPSTGRYVESDPIGLYGGSFSTYAYTGSNPIGRSDPEGLQYYFPPDPHPENNTVVCDGEGGMSVQTVPGEYLGCGTGECIRQHETQHIRDLSSAYGSSVCRGKPRGSVVGFTYADICKLYQSEMRAYEVQLACLEEMLKKQCKDCAPSLQANIKQVKQLLAKFKALSANCSVGGAK